MKTTVRHFTSHFGVIFLVLVAVLLLAAGCATHSDPLAGWKFMYLGQLDRPIVEDYEAFIQTLPPKERIQVDKYSVDRYEDGRGGHAVRFRIGKDGIVNGTWWYYVLIYSNENKRVKVMNYADGKYSQW